ELPWESVPWPTPGSLGHPELCTRPCLYFASGRCVNDINCGFCHLPHAARPSHLDKRSRLLLKSLPANVRGYLLQEAVLDRARSLSLQINTQDFRSLFEQLCGSSLLCATTAPAPAPCCHLANDVAVDSSGVCGLGSGGSGRGL
ncbi:unnamed protein product, partial [Polarella glacialis]